jgi:hypothetical protein
VWRPALAPHLRENAAQTQRKRNTTQRGFYKSLAISESSIDSNSVDMNGK